MGEANQSVPEALQPLASGLARSWSLHVWIKRHAKSFFLANFRGGSEGDGA